MYRRHLGPGTYLVSAGAGNHEGTAFESDECLQIYRTRDLDGTTTMSSPGKEPTMTPPIVQREQQKTILAPCQVPA